MSRVLPNPFVGVNYIPDNVRMEIPPAHWLQSLYDFDSQLVVFPSRQRPFSYVLARRCTRTAGLTAMGIVDPQSDTGMCVHHKTIPVTLIIRHGAGWSIDNILRDLAARDTWRHGGANKFCDKLEAQEDAQQQKVQKNIREDMWHRSGDAWRSYQSRTGGSTLRSVGNAVQGAATQTPTTTTAAMPRSASGSAVVR